MITNPSAITRPIPVKSVLCLRQGHVVRENHRGRSRFTNAASVAWQSLSGLLQNFYHLVRIVQRVHRHIGEKLCANHGGREAAQVNSRVGKLPSQVRGDARPVTACDSNGMEGMRNVKTHLRGRSDFPVTPEWRDEHYSFAGFCAPGDDELQVCARFPKLSQHGRKAAGSVFDGRRPHIDMFHIFHERIHNSSPSSQLLCAKCSLGHEPKRCPHCGGKLRTRKQQKPTPSGTWVTTGLFLQFATFLSPLSLLPGGFKTKKEFLFFLASRDFQTRTATTRRGHLSPSFVIFVVQPVFQVITAELPSSFQVPVIPSPRVAFAAPSLDSVISNGCPAVSFTFHTPSKALAARAAKLVTTTKQVAVTAALVAFSFSALPFDRTAHGRNLLFRTMACFGDLFHCFK
jgi:hypothetical protein